MEERLASVWIQQEEQGQRLYVINWTDRPEGVTGYLPQREGAHVTLLAQDGIPDGTE